MSIPVLIQVYDEMRRLAIAGSAVAAGDFRLKKLVLPLEKSGEKAPVFAKVAQAVQAVVDSTDKTAATALLELATLVNAILYTQGETGIAGELKPIETTDLGGHVTQAGARILKPLLEALSSTGSGRLELIRDAVERGAFKDLRLVKPALAAIDDPYPEIADLIAEKVLPLYGRAIVPELRARIDLKGKGGHLHRLELLHRLDPAGSRDLIQAALADGSKEMKVAAILCLGTAAEDITSLLDLSKAKARDVRAAALRALTAVTAPTAEVIATLKKAVTTDDLELIIARVRKSEIPELRDFVLAQADQQLAALLKTKDKKEQGVAVSRLQQLVRCLDAAADPRAEAFLLGLFEKRDALSAIKSEPAGTDLSELVAHRLSQGTPAMRRALVEAHQSLAGDMLASAILAARAILPPADFYGQFHPLLKEMPDKRTKKGAADFGRGEGLINVLNSDDDHAYHRRWGTVREAADRGASPLPPLDPRWLDAAVAVGSARLVCQLARPGHQAANDFLAAELAKKKEPHDAHQLLRAMVRVRHPAAADTLVELLKKQAKETTYHYFSYWYGRLIADLPRADYPKFEALLPTLPDKMVDQLMDSVIALKNKPE